MSNYGLDDSAIAAHLEEDKRLQAEQSLIREWEMSLLDAGIQQAFYAGDKDALVAAVNEALSVIQNG